MQHDIHQGNGCQDEHRHGYSREMARKRSIHDQLSLFALVRMQRCRVGYDLAVVIHASRTAIAVSPCQNVIATNRFSAFPPSRIGGEMTRFGSFSAKRGTNLEAMR